VLIAVAVGAITRLVATTAAFAISRSKSRAGAPAEPALFTYFIPAAFLAVPMYKTMGNYGLLNSQWALILAMVTIAAPVLHLGVEADFGQIALRAGRSGAYRWRLAAATVPPCVPPFDVCRRWWRWDYSLLLAWNDTCTHFCVSKDTSVTSRRWR